MTEKSQRLLGSQAFTACLEAASVERIYGIVGTSNIALVNELYDKRDTIRYISTRHEQVAASMADAEGRLTGKPGMCLVHSGPGALNAMLGVATARKDCSPVIVVTGSVKPALSRSDGAVEADHCRLFEPVCKAVFKVDGVAGIPSIFSEAYRVAMTPAKGPVLIDVPENLWREEDNVDLDSMEMAKPSPKEIDRGTLQEIFRLFKDSVRPLILAGGGILQADATDNLRRLAEEANVRVATTGNGRGVLPETHDLCLCRTGFFGNPVADTAMEQADLILALGCCLSDRTTYEYSMEIAGKVVAVNASPDAHVIIPESYKVDLMPVTADVGDFLSKFLDMLHADPVKKSDDWMDSLLPIGEQWEAQLAASATSDKAPVSPGRVVRAVSDLAPDDAIFATGAGLNAIYICDFLKVKNPRSLVAPNNFGAMCFGFPAAMACKIIHPDRPVVSILGDGDFMMTIQDIETAVREGVVATVVILNDNSYRALRYGQQIVFGGRIYGSEHNNPDFVKLADSFGAAGYLIETPDQIEPTLREAMNCGKLAIVDARIDVDDIAPTNIQAILKMRGFEQ